MNTLVKSFRPVGNYPGLFNTLFNDGEIFNESRQRQSTPAANVSESDEAFKIELAAPGFKKEDFKVNVDGKNLKISTVNAEEEQEEESKETYLRKEFSFSSFERLFYLPKSVDVDKIEASYIDGILNLSLPKREEAKPKEPRLINVG
ncbi:Hsp20/alpha crystallin family protein [Arcticibacterium luteifluviistationis]|uniref:Heat-shock protein Hsp20 n=1 Tax=Arcticibacterium luteifluviistationis TaxID=1784714 RepID=A0A2Z4GI79_9BACT|nr:Hsp20/alpha crystallin family protein [Arcticibacterium luteifluviistationis]AWW00952.1 heat-shock protein Hsp20 [Arcticibacterium luteifluviistationis]